jgi:hypothetical protein
MIALPAATVHETRDRARFRGAPHRGDYAYDKGDDAARPRQVDYDCENIRFHDHPAFRDVRSRLFLPTKS